ncbi:TRAP transporter large permease subunit [Nigerium massiliense]|uniref:TRAP transporter large permease subunit n=1 Tax=Nigerium massiliense TaxID=1522317 RepID=UPI00058B1910|nr:TRAP transporter large permease subunit [Nigerium massiliense]
MGVVALLIFIAVTVLLNVLLKRDIAEALLVALVATSLAGGAQAPQLLWGAVVRAVSNDVTFAGMAFVFMGVLVAQTGLIGRLIHIFDAVFGRLPGGAAYVSTLGSAAVGLVAGSTAGNAATVGSVTIPWMKENGWSSRRAATLVAGNSGLGVSLPPNSTMFIILGAAPVAALGVTGGQVYVSLLVAGAYCVLYRMLVVWLWTRRDRIPAVASRGQSFLQAVREGWTSLLIFLGITIPVLLTFGPIFDYLSAPGRVGEAISTVSIIVHVPILISLIAVIEGWNRLKGRWGEVARAMRAEVPQFATVGISLFAALAASDIMSRLGVGKQLNEALVGSHLPKPLMILLVAVLCIIVATPLSSTATAAAIGAPSVVALSALGVPPVVAVCTVLVCTSTEGASPPVGAPIYLASGMAEVDPKETFVPLIVWFVVPIIGIAWLLGMGWLPIPH